MIHLTTGHLTALAAAAGKGREVELVSGRGAPSCHIMLLMDLKTKRRAAAPGACCEPLAALLVCCRYAAAGMHRSLQHTANCTHKTHDMQYSFKLDDHGHLFHFGFESLEGAKVS